MPSPQRRASGRRPARGRGPCSPGLESLEGRTLLNAGAGALPDLVNSGLNVSSGVADWGSTIEVAGKVTNQGNAATDAPFQVEVYASPVRGVNRFAVPIGQVTIPAGLAPGQSVSYQSAVTLPATPVPHVASTGGTVYIASWVDQGKAVPESNYRNNRDIGPPYDSVPVSIQPPTPAQLVGTTLAVSTPTTTWGSTITVTAQVTNEGNGRSPQTTALLSLTPQGLNYGSAATVGIGTITIPPLGPSQTYNIAQQITLPAVEPVAVSGYTQFGLTMTQDANYLTNALYPNVPDQGSGYDQAAIAITTDPNSTATAGPLPDLAASSIMGPTQAIRWGQSFPVSTQVQNLGPGDAGPFQVFFMLTGQAGTLGNSIYLGQAMVSGLAAGQTQQVSQTLTLPSRLPAGVTLNGVGYGRIAAVVDPSNFINESLKSNNESLSPTFIVRLPGAGANSVVPTQPSATASPSVTAVASQAKNAKRSASLRQRAAARRSAHPARAAALANGKLHRHAPPPTNSITDKGLNLAKEIAKLPHQIESVLTKAIK